MCVTARGGQWCVCVTARGWSVVCVCVTARGWSVVCHLGVVSGVCV